MPVLKFNKKMKFKLIPVDSFPNSNYLNRFSKEYKFSMRKLKKICNSNIQGYDYRGS